MTQSAKCLIKFPFVIFVFLLCFIDSFAQTSKESLYLKDQVAKLQVDLA